MVSVLSLVSPGSYFRCMKVYEAIDRMRRMTAEGVPFSFSFMSYNGSERRSDGVIEVRHAKLRKRTMKEHHRHAEFVEEYTDLDTLENRRFYQPLLLSFNGEKVVLE